MEQVKPADDAVLPGYKVLTPAGWKKVVRVGKTTDAYVYVFDDGSCHITNKCFGVSVQRPN